MEIKYVVNYGLKDRFEWQSAILMKWKSREKRKWDRWIHLVNLRRVTIVKTDRLSFEYCHSKLEIELRRKWFSNKKRTRLVMINCDGKRLVVLWRFRFFMIFQKMHPRVFNRSKKNYYFFVIYRKRSTFISVQLNGIRRKWTNIGLEQFQ